MWHILITLITLISQTWYWYKCGTSRAKDIKKLLNLSSIVVALCDHIFCPYFIAQYSDHNARLLLKFATNTVYETKCEYVFLFTWKTDKHLLLLVICLLLKRLYVSDMVKNINYQLGQELKFHGLSISLYWWSNKMYYVSQY